MQLLLNHDNHIRKKALVCLFLFLVVIIIIILALLVQLFNASQLGLHLEKARLALVPWQSTLGFWMKREWKGWGNLINNENAKAMVWVALLFTDILVSWVVFFFFSWQQLYLFLYPDWFFFPCFSYIDCFKPLSNSFICVQYSLCFPLLFYCFVVFALVFAVFSHGVLLLFLEGYCRWERREGWLQIPNYLSIYPSTHLLYPSRLHTQSSLALVAWEHEASIVWKSVDAAKHR